MWRRRSKSQEKHICSIVDRALAKILGTFLSLNMENKRKNWKRIFYFSTMRHASNNWIWSSAFCFASSFSRYRSLISKISKSRNYVRMCACFRKLAFAGCSKLFNFFSIPATVRNENRNKYILLTQLWFYICSFASRDDSICAYKCSPYSFSDLLSAEQRQLLCSDFILRYTPKLCRIPFHVLVYRNGRSLIHTVFGKRIRIFVRT